MSGTIIITSGDQPVCRFCGKRHLDPCPSVAAIEYSPDGAVRRVEFRAMSSQGAKP